MPKQTNMIGKDSTLEKSIRTLQHKLRDKGFHIVEQTALNPIDNIWSVIVFDEDCSLLSASGTDNTKNKALFKALNQFIEYLASDYFWINYYLGDIDSKSNNIRFSNEKMVQNKYQWLMAR